MRRLSRIRAGEELRFLLLRLNDWVAPVRDRARSAVLARIEPDYAVHFVACLPMVSRLGHLGRVDHGEVVGMVSDLLTRPSSLEALLAGVAHPDRDVRRATLICGVAYGENVDDAREVIEAAVRKVDLVRDDVRDIQVFAKAFGASSIDFEITWWTGSRPVDIRASRDQVVASVKAALDEAGIEIPFPYRTLTVNEPIPVAPVGGNQAER